MKTGPFVIIDDDPEDREIIAEVLRELGAPNELRFFENGQQALDYLYTTIDRPFLILSDINMPLMNGLQLRSNINKDPFLIKKSIPFIFYTTHATEEAVKEAYYMAVQGFFEKPHSIGEIKKLLEKIISYWSVCRHVNN